jgi:hypothetical protein
MSRVVVNGAAALLAAAVMTACQSPTSTEDTLDVDDYVDVVVNPNPAQAGAADGRTYRVVRGNNQPDEILAFDWRTSFTLTVTLNQNATDGDLDLTFPVDITAATAKVQQASGGIVSPPTGTEVEHYEAVLAQASSNRFAGANSTNTMAFDVWYDLPSLRREALVTVTLAFRDDKGKTFSKNVEVRVAP